MSAPLASSAPSGWTTPEKIFGYAITLVTLIASIGGAVATTRSQIEEKLDRSEYQRGQAATDQRFVRDSLAHAAEAERWRRVEIGVDSANLRLRQIWCDGKPASCR